MTGRNPDEEACGSGSSEDHAAAPSGRPSEETDRRSKTRAACLRTSACWSWRMTPGRVWPTSRRRSRRPRTGCRGRWRTEGSPGEDWRSSRRGVALAGVAARQGTPRASFWSWASSSSGRCGCRGLGRSVVAVAGGSRMQVRSRLHGKRSRVRQRVGLHGRASAASARIGERGPARLRRGVRSTCGAG